MCAHSAGFEAEGQICSGGSTNDRLGLYHQGLAGHQLRIELHQTVLPVRPSAGLKPCLCRSLKLQGSNPLLNSSGSGGQSRMMSSFLMRYARTVHAQCHHQSCCMYIAINKLAAPSGSALSIPWSSFAACSTHAYTHLEGTVNESCYSISMHP